MHGSSIFYVGGKCGINFAGRLGEEPSVGAFILDLTRVFRIVHTGVFLRNKFLRNGGYCIQALVNDHIAEVDMVDRVSRLETAADFAQAVADFEGDVSSE
jgi:hypothetical protein